MDWFDSRVIRDGVPLADLAADHPLTRAHSEARDLSRERLEALLSNSIDVDQLRAPAEDELAPRGGRLPDSMVNELRPDQLIEAALQRWSRFGGGAVGVALTAPTKQLGLDRFAWEASQHEPIPQMDLRRIAGHVEDGWVVSVLGAVDTSPALLALVEHLERVLGLPLEVVLKVGTRTSVGGVDHHPDLHTLLLQVGGRRSLQVNGPGEDRQRNQMVGRGALLHLPPGWTAAHVPVDAFTAHIEFSFGPETELDAAGRAHMRPRAPNHFGRVLRFLSEPLVDHHQVRGPVPGGAVAVEGEPGRYAMGGYELTIDDALLDQFARLLTGQPVSVGDIPDIAAGAVALGLASPVGPVGSRPAPDSAG